METSWRLLKWLRPEIVKVWTGRVLLKCQRASEISGGSHPYRFWFWRGLRDFCISNELPSGADAGLHITLWAALDWSEMEEVDRFQYIWEVESTGFTDGLHLGDKWKRRFSDDFGALVKQPLKHLPVHTESGKCEEVQVEGEKIKSSALGMLSLRGLWDIQMEMSIMRWWVLMLEMEDWGDLSMEMKFKVMALDEMVGMRVTLGKRRNWDWALGIRHLEVRKAGQSAGRRTTQRLNVINNRRRKPLGKDSMVRNVAGSKVQYEGSTEQGRAPSGKGKKQQRDWRTRWESAALCNLSWIPQASWLTINSRWKGLCAFLLGK